MTESREGQNPPGSFFCFSRFLPAEGKPTFEWIFRKQLNKHNLNDEQITYITGEMFKARKKSVGAQVGNKNAEKQIAQNEPIVSGGTAEVLAHEEI